MGLFGKKNKADQPLYGSIEGFYDGETAQDLMSFAKKMLQMRADYERVADDLCGCSFKAEYWSKWTYAPTLVLKQKITSELKKDLRSPDAIHLLRYLESRGDCPNAAFFLGVLYEHGLTNVTPQSMEEANTHYGIAEAQGSLLPAVLNAIRGDIRIADGVTSHPGEALAYNLLSAPHNPAREEILKPLSEQDRDDLLHIATVAFAHYTSLKLPWSTAYVGNALWQRKQWIKTDKAMSDIFSVASHESNGRDMCATVLRAAEAGNTHAIASCRVLGIHR